VAGDWIKMRVDLTDDPAVISIADALQVNETHVVGLLHKAWCWADRHAENGHAKSVTLSWLDRHIGVTGFAQAMVSVGWLAVDDGLKFPHFDRHNGESAKKRSAATERKPLERHRHTNVTGLSRSSHNKSVTREEKRREEVKQAIPPNGGSSELWDFGVTVLTEQGLKEGTARSFLGSLLRDYEAGDVEGALRSAVGKAEVKSYLLGVLKDKRKKGEPERLKVAL